MSTIFTTSEQFTSMAYEPIKRIPKNGCLVRIERFLFGKTLAQVRKANVLLPGDKNLSALNSTLPKDALSEIEERLIHKRPALEIVELNVSPG